MTSDDEPDDGTSDRTKISCRVTITIPATSTCPKATRSPGMPKKEETCFMPPPDLTVDQTLHKVANHKIFTYAAFNLSALLDLGEKLRRVPCSCDPSERPLCGSLDWAVTLAFDDGAEWIFRSPRRPSHRGVSGEYAGLLLSSEVATLRYVREKTLVPVPEVFDYRRAIRTVHYR